MGSDKVNYEVHLVDINGVRFADLLPEDQIGHLILKVLVADGRLRISFFDSEWLRQRVPHEEADMGKGQPAGRPDGAHTPAPRSGRELRPGAQGI